MIFLFRYFSIKEPVVGNKNGFDVYLVDHSRIQSLYDEIHDDPEAADATDAGLKRKCMFRAACPCGVEQQDNGCLCISGEFDGEDSSNSKLFRNFAGIDKKAATNKDSMNSTDNDIMVRPRRPMNDGPRRILTDFFVAVIAIDAIDA